MSTITMSEIQTLLASRSRWCVSLFLPTHRAGKESEQDPIRLKNMLRDVEDTLVAKGMRSPEAKELLKPVQAAAQEPGFWQHYSDGLAIFVDPDNFHHFHLPIPFGERTVIANRFFIRPLLPMLTANGDFYILALSRNQVRLLGGNRFTIEDKALAGFPLSLAESMKYEDTVGNRQYRSGVGSGGGHPSVYHGHETGEDEKDQLFRWFREIDEGIKPILGTGKMPMLLAAVDYYRPIYKEANTYAHLMEEGISGNPDDLKAETLHAQACAMLEPYFNLAREKAIDQYRSQSAGNKASSELKEVVPAAFQGRISTLFITLGAQVWGRFNPSTNSVEVHLEPELGDEDLLDLAAIQTILNGGTVYALQPELMPEDAQLAALFRF